MTTLQIVCFFLLFTYWKSNSEAKGFVVSSSKHWIRNDTNPLLVSRFVNNSNQELFIKVELSSNSYHQVIDFGSIQESDEIFHIPAPDNDDIEFKMKVKIFSSDDSYVFQKDFSIIVTSRDDFVFIQTDKPFYKPSDKVRVRTLVLGGKDLKPQDNKITKAYIADSKNTVVGQWLNPSSKFGIYDFEFPLSSEPRLGDWEFVVETSYARKTRKFEVLRYVLPKFSLLVVSDPKYLLFSYNVNISFKVCAKYSYNKPVAGDVYFKMSDGTEHSFELDGNGCHTLTLVNYELLTLGFRSSHSFHVSVTVVERETGISMSTTHETAIYKSIFLKYSPYCSDHVKPGIGYRCRVQAHFVDNVKARGVKFAIYKNGGELLDDDVISDDDGFILVIIPPIYHENFTYHSLRIAPEKPYVIMDLSKDLYLKRWRSPSSTYLGVVNNCDEEGFVEVDRFNLTFNLVTNRSLLEGDVMLRYVVYSDGHPLKVGNFSLIFGNLDHFETESHPSTSGDEIVFHRHKHSREVDLSGVVGMATLLLYLQLDGEVIADNIKFRVKFKPKKQMELFFMHEKLQPGKETSLQINFPGRSLCAVSVYDKSLEMLSPADHLDYDKIQDHWKVQRPVVLFKPQKSCDIDDDPNNSLAPVWDRRGRPTFTGSKDAFQVDDLTVHSDFEVSREFCKPFDFEEEVTPELFMMSPLGGSPPHSPDHRDFFPESWIWNFFEIEEGEEGTNMTFSLPHTITEWTGSGFCIGPEVGLGVSPKFSIVGFQPFFLSLHLPYSVVKGERVVVPLSVHSYLDSCIKVELDIKHSNHLNVFKLKSNEMILCNGVPGVVNLTIGAKKVGEVNLTIEARSYSVETNSSVLADEINVRDIVTYTILVEPEGKPEEINQNVFVCAPASGEFLLNPPDGEIVKDSIKSYVAVSGDLMASALAGLENLLGLPTGCGEQIMVKFVPNIFILDYLKESKLLTEEVERKAIDYLKIGYQRSLQFRHEDGSYSAFGEESDKGGSLWLTAFIVKSLVGARRYIQVDDANLDVSLEFIKNSQFNDGCFPLIGELFQRSLMGHMEHDDFVPSAAYNAYIVSSLIEAGVTIDDVSVLKGFECLERNFLNSSDNSMYDDALLLYAHSLVIHERRSYMDAYNRLLSHLLRKSVNGVHLTLGGKDEAVDVEITSYVMLSLLRSEQLDLSQLLGMANWLIGKRSPKGGFYSTQDTMVALNALSNMARHVSDPSNVTVTFTSLKKISPFLVNPANKLLVQKVDTGNLLKRTVKYSVKGDGCVSVKAGTNFNVIMFGGDQHSISVFNISVGLKQVETTCKQMMLHACFVYNGEGESTNMGIVVIHLPTGWIGDRESIHLLLENVQINLKNFEIDEKSIKFYFDEITKLETCLHFKIRQDVFVVQTKPARVEIFDYYNLTLSTFVEYVIHQRCPQLQKGKEFLPPLSRRLRSIANDCPLFVPSLTSEDVKLACSKKFSYWLRRDEGSRNIRLVSSNSPSIKMNEIVKVKFGHDCDPQPSSWEEIIISTDEEATMQDEPTLELQNDDIVMATDQDITTGIASDVRSIACDRWSHE